MNAILKLISLSQLALALMACSTLEKPYFYKAEKDGKQLYILGTIHMGVPAQDLPNFVHDRLRQAKVAFFEADIAQLIEHRPSTPEERRKFYLNEGKIRPGEPTLDQRLTAPEFARLQKEVGPVAARRLKQMRPMWALALATRDETVRVTRYEARLSEPENSMDYTLFKEAQSAHVPVIVLDKDITEQCRASIDRLYLEGLKKWLAGRSAEDDYKEVSAMVEAYRSANDTYLIQHIHASIMHEACILEDRNRDWVWALHQTVQPGEQAFVAVGVGHLLPGDEATVLDLLKAEGYSVERIKK